MSKVVGISLSKVPSFNYTVFFSGNQVENAPKYWDSIVYLLLSIV